MSKKKSEITKRSKKTKMILDVNSRLDLMDLLLDSNIRVVSELRQTVEKIEKSFTELDSWKLTIEARLKGFEVSVLETSLAHAGTAKMAKIINEQMELLLASMGNKGLTGLTGEKMKKLIKLVSGSDEVVSVSDIKKAEDNLSKALPKSLVRGGKKTKKRRKIPPPPKMPANVTNLPKRKK